MPETFVEVRRAQPWLGTRVEIVASGGPTVAVEAAIEAAFAAIAGVHRALSAQDADSELTRVNRAALGAPQAVSQAFREVLACALDVARESGGAFDPALGALPAAARAVAARSPAAPRATWRDVRLHDGEVGFARPLALDFDGIAKGYAVDRAIAALVAGRVNAACVNAGGDLRVIGPRDETVHVRTGGAQSVLLPVATIGDAALATSAYGGARRSSGGRFRTPLIEPRNRLPVMSTRTVSIVAPTCMLADALTKVVALRGRRAAATLARFGACATILTPARGTWRCTRISGARAPAPGAA